MIKLFKSNTPLVYAFAIVFTLLVGAEVFLKSESEPLAYFGWYTSLLETIGKNRFLNYILTTILIVLTGSAISRAFNKTSFYQKTTAFPIFIFIVILSTFGGFYFKISYIIDFIFALVFIGIIDLDQNKSAVHVGFKSGILLGITFLFSYWLIPIGLLVFFSLNIFRPFQWREWVVSILGMVLPTIYLLSLRYLFFDSYGVPEKVFSAPLNVSYWYDYLSCSLASLIVLLACFKLRRQFSFISNIERKQINILVFFNVLTIAFGATVFFIYGVFSIIFVVPLTLLIAVPIMNSKNNRLINALFGFLLILNLLRIFVF